MNIWKVCVLQMEFEVKRLFLWEVEDKVQEGGDAYCQSLRMYLSMKLNLFGSIYMYMYTYICQSWKVCVLQMEFEVERIFFVGGGRQSPGRGRQGFGAVAFAKTQSISSSSLPSSCSFLSSASASSLSPSSSTFSSSASSSSLGQRAWPGGIVEQGYSQAGTFQGVLNVSLCASGAQLRLKPTKNFENPTCICMIFLQCEFLDESSNCLYE